MCAHISIPWLALATYLEPRLSHSLIVYSACLPFFCCSLIHFSSLHWNCVSRAAAGFSVRILYYSYVCGQRARTGSREEHARTHAHELTQKKRFLQSKWSFRILEGNLQSPADFVLFIGANPQFFLGFSPAPVNFACGAALFLVATLHLTPLRRPQLRCEPDPDPPYPHAYPAPPIGGGGGKWIQHTWSAFQLVSS